VNRCTTAIVAALFFLVGVADAAWAQGIRPPLKPPQPPPTPAHPTFGQGEEHGAFVTVAGTFLLNSASFASAIQPIDFGERASIDTHYAGAIMPGFEIGAGKRVWHRLSIGGSVERVSKSGGGEVAAQVPHPFFFNRLRAVAGQAADIHRAETGVHVQAVWVVPLAAGIDLGFGGGPSWIGVTQDLVSDVTVAQTYPYDAATFSSAVTNRETEGALGFNAGMTLDYRFARRMSAAVTARFSHARVEFNVANGNPGTLGVNAGGAHLGAGVRFRF